MADYTEGFKILNVTDPENPSLLGELNDVAVARSVLHEVTSSGAMFEMAASWLDKRERNRMHEAERHLISLASANLPWA